MRSGMEPYSMICVGAVPGRLSSGSTVQRSRLHIKALFIPLYSSGIYMMGDDLCYQLIIIRFMDYNTSDVGCNGACKSCTLNNKLEGVRTC